MVLSVLCLKRPRVLGCGAAQCAASSSPAASEVPVPYGRPPRCIDLSHGPPSLHCSAAARVRLVTVTSRRPCRLNTGRRLPMWQASPTVVGCCGPSLARRCSKSSRFENAVAKPRGRRLIAVTSRWRSARTTRRSRERWSLCALSEAMMDGAHNADAPPIRRAWPGASVELEDFLDVHVRFLPQTSSSSHTGQRALIGATCTLRLNVRMPCPDV